MDKQTLMNGIGERLRKERKKLGLTQEKTAELLGISVTFYGEIERGKKGVSIEKLMLIDEVLKIEPTYLITGRQLTGEKVYQMFGDCPKDKEYLVEQLTRIVSLLYK